MHIIKLYPPKNNSYAIDEPCFGSSSLFGALANNFVLLYGSNTFDEFLQFFDRGLKISSMFPALKLGEKEIFFLPKPYIHFNNPNQEDKLELQNRKKAKKLKWISFGVLNRIKESLKYENGNYFHTLNLVKDPDLIQIRDEFVGHKNELPAKIGTEGANRVKLYEKYSAPRVYTPRFGLNSIPFCQNQISFVNRKIEDMTFQLFLYFLCENNPTEKKWTSTLKLFSEEGIGGQRNLGKGWFEKIEFDEFNLLNLPDNNREKLNMLLSNYIPKKDELSKIISYNTDVDDGFITYGSATPYKKGRLMFITSASVVNGNVEGKIIKEEFKGKTIYRYGKAFLIPLTEVHPVKSIKGKSIQGKLNTFI
jgi:CRISPR type III-A-associated RAMP protein Csm4